MRRERGWTAITAALVSIVVAALNVGSTDAGNATSPPTRPSASFGAARTSLAGRLLAQPPTTTDASNDLYAYTRNGSRGVVVMDGRERIGTIERDGTDTSIFSSSPTWSDDGHYVAGTNGTELMVLNVETGTVRRARCACGAVTFWDGDVVAAESTGRGRNTLMRFDLPDLSNARSLTGRMPPGITWYHLQGGGDALVAFGYDTEVSAAHLALDVVVVRRDGSGYRLGEPLLGNTAQSSAYSPTTVSGEPRIAYETSADGGSCLRQSGVTLVDPDGVQDPVVTDFASMRPEPAATTSNEVHDLWFGRDGSLYASGESWSCDERTGAATPHERVSVWRLDGRRWVQADDSRLLAAREFHSGNGIELVADAPAQGGHFPTGTLGYVTRDRRVRIAQGVDAVTAPARIDESRAWLALGDSYSSGEGIEGNAESRSTYQPPTDDERAAGETRDCRRATGVDMDARAWAAGAYILLRKELRLVEQTFVACTGALAHEAVTQIEEAKATSGRDTWDVVSFSFGGNDIGFAGIVDGCTDINEVRGGSWKEKWPDGCNVGEVEIRARIDALAGEREAAPGYSGTMTLPEMYDEVARVVAPGGDVVVAGYPNLIEAPDRWPPWRLLPPYRCAFIDSIDVWMLRRLGAYLNLQIGAAVRAADERHRGDGVRFHFVDISKNPYELDHDPRNRHGLCSDHSWINGLTLDFEDAPEPRIGRSFHPNQEGYDATARVIAQSLRG